MRAFELAAGVAIVLVVLFDVFQSVVLPRPTPAIFRPSAVLFGSLWAATTWVALRLRSPGRRELILGTFAPLMVVLLLLSWVVALILGYALMLDVMRADLHPAPSDFGTVLYFSGVSLLTIGFGDVVPVGGMVRGIALCEAATGLAIVALVITFLFTLFGSYQRRETQVITLSARAGAPPSGVALLQTYAKLEMLPDLGRTFADWEGWSAEVLDSHLSYPILAFFRSTHDNQSWISALGAVLDAATLVITTIEGVPRGPAVLLSSVGVHLVEDLAQYFRLDGRGDPYVERGEFLLAREQLAAVGYRLRPEEASWAAFAARRAEYAGALNALAKRWVTPPALWIGDRSTLRLRGRHAPNSSAGQDMPRPFRP